MLIDCKKIIIFEHYRLGDTAAGLFWLRPILQDDLFDVIYVSDSVNIGLVKCFTNNAKFETLKRWRRGYNLQSFFYGFIGSIKMRYILKRYPTHVAFDIRPDIFSRIATFSSKRKVYRYPLVEENFGSCYKTMLINLYGKRGVETAFKLAKLAKKELRNFSEKKIIFCPFGSIKNKSLTIEQIARFINNAPEHIEIDIPLENKKKYNELKRDLEPLLSTESRKKLTYIYSKTILDLVEVIKSGEAVFCVDSAPVHIAALYDLKTFEVLGPNPIDKVAPQNPDVNIIPARKISCAPCEQRTCINEKTNDCFDLPTLIEVSKNF